MGQSEPTDEPPLRLQRGAFPTSKSWIARAKRFDPESAHADNTDDEATSPETEDATGTPTSAARPDVRP